MEKDNLEKTVADAILERAADSVTIDDVEYPLCPPTPATLIMVSELAASLPVVQRKPEEGVLREVLATARGMNVLGRMVAVLLLGAKRVREKRLVRLPRQTLQSRWSWKHMRRVKQTCTVEKAIPEICYLGGRLLEELSPETLLRIVSKRLGMMQIGAFFELTTSLSGANMLRATKEVETASGAKS